MNKANGSGNGYGGDMCEICVPALSIGTTKGQKSPKGGGCSFYTAGIGEHTKVVFLGVYSAKVT